MRNVGNCLLTLVNRFDQELSAPDFVADVILYFTSISILCHDVLVSVADAQMRNLVAVEDDLVFAVHFFNGHIWHHVIFWGLGKDRPWSGFQLRNIIGAFLHLLDANAYAPRDFRETALAQILHMFGNDFVFQTVAFAVAF